MINKKIIKNIRRPENEEKELRLKKKQADETWDNIFEEFLHTHIFDKNKFAHAMYMCNSIDKILLVKGYKLNE